MDYKEKYEQALERARNIRFGNPQSATANTVCEEIFPELKESEDEKMLNVAINACKYMVDNFENSTKQYENCIAWLEKQGEHANFRNKIQIGDEVTRNEDGILVNLSQLERVAKERVKQGEHKPTEKVEPKFKVGDWIYHEIKGW